MIIEFLQEQIHDLILEVDDAHAHIDELQQQLVPPAVPVVPEGGEEDPRGNRGSFRSRLRAWRLSHPIYKNINRAIIYAPGSSHAYIQ
jgi:hypothetical protein